MNFRNKYSLGERLEKNILMRRRYPEKDFISVVVSCSDAIFPSHKSYYEFAVESHLTILIILHHLQKYTHNHQAQFYFQCHRKLVQTESQISQVYSQNSSKDGYLYLELKKQDVF